MDDVTRVTEIFFNLPLFSAVLARIAGLVAFAPFFGSLVIPAKVRIFLAFAITVIVFPFVHLSSFPTDLGSIVILMVSEFLIGLLIGIIFHAIFAGLELAGLMVGQQLGIALARVFDPMFEEEVSALGRLYHLLAIVIFLLIRGHLILVKALIGSFDHLPLGTFVVNENVVSMMISALRTSFIVAAQVSAPIIVAIFLATLAMGFITRTVPQFNILTVGFSIRLILGFILVVICLTPTIEVFLNGLDKIFGDISSILGVYD